jgi:hypothetical protein
VIECLASKESSRSGDVPGRPHQLIRLAHARSRLALKNRTSASAVSAEQHQVGSPVSGKSAGGFVRELKQPSIRSLREDSVCPRTVGGQTDVRVAHFQIRDPCCRHAIEHPAHGRILALRPNLPQLQSVLFGVAAPSPGLASPTASPCRMYCR